jgi:hypothetical protein
LLALAQGNINASYSLLAANAPGRGTPENLVDTRGPCALAFSFAPRQAGRASDSAAASMARHHVSMQEQLGICIRIISTGALGT